MPTYLIKCDKCGKEDEIFRKISEMDDLPECCEVKMHRVLAPSMVLSDIQPYQSMIDGSMVTSRSKHREHLKRNNCIEVGNETKHLFKKPEIKAPPGLRKQISEIVYSKMRS